MAEPRSGPRLALLVAVFAVAGLTAIALPSASLSAVHVTPPASTASGSRAPSLATGTHRSGTNYTISGRVLLSEGRNRGLGHVNVTLLSTQCGALVPSFRCPTVAATQTNLTGHFSLRAPNGTYYLASTNGSGWGGAWEAVQVQGASARTELVAPAWEAYSVSTLVLPAWNNLSAYAANCNLALPCKTAPYGTQVPVLSWTQDGAFYVDASLDLVFYSFVNRTVVPIASWRPLYQNLMFYDGIENTEWATVDDSYVYTFGCPTVCVSNSSVDLYAVNVSTGRTFFHTFTGVERNALFENAQIDLIGLAGNHSIAALLEANGTVLAYDLWNQSQWILGKLAFFEANNCYWVPSLDSYVDVEAGGSSKDLLIQYRLVDSSTGWHLVVAYEGSYATGYAVNGVDGLYLNVTSRRMYVTESSGTGSLRTEAFAYSPNGTLRNLVVRYADSSLGIWPNDSAPPNVFSSEHRPELTGWGPFRMGFYDGLFDNNSWQFEPSTGRYIGSNVSLSDPPGGSGPYRENGPNPGAVEGLFLNTSYGLLESSVDCRTVNSSCMIRGTAVGSVPGTVQWSWRTGMPEFPFSAKGPLAQTEAPPAPRVTLQMNGTNATLTWSGPSAMEAPLLDYRLRLNDSSAGVLVDVDLPAFLTSYRVGSIPPNSTLHYSLAISNLHGRGQSTWGAFVLPNPLLMPPRDVRASAWHSDGGALSRWSEAIRSPAEPGGFTRQPSPWTEGVTRWGVAKTEPWPACGSLPPEPPPNSRALLAEPWFLASRNDGG